MVRMTDNRLDRSTMAALGQINPRRFELLLVCISLGGPFSTKDLREALSSAEPSLPRDLGALEAAGLLRADPPRARARQGRPVTYTVAPETRTVFARLARLVEEAYATSSES
jgi:DNA-binding transcriptional ArsR family regulator